jgi:hypothetical protein
MSNHSEITADTHHLQLVTFINPMVTINEPTAIEEPAAIEEPDADDVRNEGRVWILSKMNKK